MLKYEWTCHQMHGATLVQNDKEEAFEIRCIVCNNYMPSLDYKMKQTVHPFVQGYDERDGWILLEFWSGTKEDCERYIEYVNDQVAYHNLIEKNNYNETGFISQTETAIYFDRLKVFTDKQEKWIKYIEEIERKEKK